MQIDREQRPLLGILVIMLASCAPDGPSAWAINRETTGPTRMPLALAPSAVGTYPEETKSGGGYFYDDVLEYRVWLHPERGAERVAAGNAYFAAFAQYERAVAFSKVTAGAEAPLVLSFASANGSMNPSPAASSRRKDCASPNGRSNGSPVPDASPKALPDSWRIRIPRRKNR